MSNNPSVARDRGTPGEDSLGCECCDHASLFDRVHSPPVGEARADLLLGHPSRTELAWLAVTKTEQEKPATGRNGSPKALDILGAFFVVEDVKQARVDHSIELLTQVTELESVAHEKPDGEASSPRLVSCEGDRLRGGIDTGGLQTAPSSEQRVFSGATTHVQDAPIESACQRQLRKDRLRSADVPRGSPVVGGVETPTRGRLPPGPWSRPGTLFIGLRHCGFLPRTQEPHAALTTDGESALSRSTGRHRWRLPRLMGRVFVHTSTGGSLVVQRLTAILASEFCSKRGRRNLVFA